MRRIVTLTFLTFVLFDLGGGFTLAQTRAARPPAAKVMTNADVIKMANVGLDDANIIAAIRGATRKSFDLSPDGMITLKQAKVSNAVISAMRGAGSAAPAVAQVEPKEPAVSRVSTRLPSTPEPREPPPMRSSAGGAPGSFTLFISAPQRDGFFDTSKGIQDSIRDVRKQLSKEKHVAFTLTDDRSQAQVVLTVVQRGVGLEAYGQRIGVIQYYYSGAELQSTSMVAATYWVSAVLQVGKYKKEFTGSSLDTNPTRVFFRAVTYGAWGRCAEQIAGNLASWVSTNANLIRRNIR